jgi:hypothetical protein
MSLDWEDPSVYWKVAAVNTPPLPFGFALVLIVRGAKASLLDISIPADPTTAPGLRDAHGFIRGQPGWMKL